VGENLKRLESSALYYAVMTKGGKQFRQSLKTEVKQIKEAISQTGRLIRTGYGKRCFWPQLAVKQAHNRSNGCAEQDFQGHYREKQNDNWIAFLSCRHRRFGGSACGRRIAHGAIIRQRDV
jgi:hypothetical protein